MKILLTLLAVTLLPALSPVVAHAAVLTQISYQIDGVLFPPVFCNTPAGPGPINCPNVSGPVFDISQLGADSNSPGSSTISNLTSAAVDLINVSSASQALSIVMFTTDFTAPTGLLTLVSHVGGTVLKGGGDFTFQSCVDPLDRTPDVTTLAGGTCPVGSTGSGASTPNIGPAGAFSDTQFKPVALAPGTYALNQSFEIHLDPGAELNWSASTVLGSAVPEPSSSILVLGGTGLLGFGAFWRKRFFRK
jgi:hypothetical protein